MILFSNCHLYAPEFQGQKDILVAGGKIVAISDKITPPPDLDVDVIDCTGLRMFPGLIDAHVHIAGAGGEGGPSTRTPEIQLSQMLEAGVTTVIGCLGTDGMTRSVESVLMKAKALRQEGVSAWILTGSYQVPTPTILGDVGKDIAMFDEIIGVGEIAVSDHRSSCPSTAELIRLAEHARVGGMLGGKSGIVNIHMGDARDPFRPLYDAIEASELKFSQFLPTHCNRNHYIFEDAKTYGLTGYVDITASSYPFFPEDEIKPSKAVVELIAAGVPLEHITMTSDACGSLPSFDEKGHLKRLEMGQPISIFNELKDAVLQENMNLSDALKTVTSNIADILQLKSKGRIGTGKDADMVLINDVWEIIHLAANGAVLVKDRVMLKKGAYEK